MSSVSIQPNDLAKYLEEKGFICPICEDPYNLEPLRIGNDLAPNVPAALSGCVHSICMQCFRGMQKNECPMCRTAFSKVEKIHAGKQEVYEAHKAHLVEAAARQILQPAQAVAVVQPPVAPVKPPIPGNWRILDVSDLIQNQASLLEAMIPAATPAIMDAMGWNSNQNQLRAAFLEESKIAPDQWVCGINTQTSGIVGISWLVSKGLAHQLHWTGVTQSVNMPEAWKGFLLSLVKHITSYSNSQNLSITLNHFHPRETPLLQVMQQLVMQLGCACSLTWHEAKSITTIYPNKLLWNSTANVPVIQIINPTQELNHYNATKHVKVDELLTRSGLGPCMRMSCAGKGGEVEANRLCNEFRKNPQSFFCYIVDNQACGFCETTANGNVVTIKTLYLHPGHSRYKVHFIEKFLEWGFAQANVRNLRHVSSQFPVAEARDLLQEVAKSSNYDAIQSYSDTDVIVSISKKS